tara:strand:+ start:228 stop:548 length:321 start_codon:yes stop_codon:yes gene_type:complete
MSKDGTKKSFIFLVVVDGSIKSNSNFDCAAFIAAPTTTLYRSEFGFLGGGGNERSELEGLAELESPLWGVTEVDCNRTNNERTSKAVKPHCNEDGEFMLRPAATQW